MNREDLIKEIEKAFSNVELGDGIGVLEAEAIDNYASTEERKDAHDNDWRNDWRDIPDDAIEKYYSSLSFVDAKGMRFCLPAYMRFALKYFDKSHSASIDAVIYALESNPIFVKEGWEILTGKQRQVIAKFLRFMVIDVGNNYIDESSASAAYEKYWGNEDNF